MRTTLACLCRCAVLAACCFLHASKFAGRRLACLFRRPEPADGRRWGEFLLGLFESLGPTYIKIGQILSSRPDLLPPGAIAALSRLQDRVAPFDVACLPRLIEDAFGRPLDQVFESFDLLPVSSASVAHVHRARLWEGQEVAVKIRRPGIVETVRNDFRILIFLGTLLQRLPGMRALPVAAVMGEFGGVIEQQLDFELEAENNRRFRRNFQEVAGVRIPRLVDALCTNSILTMEYIADLKKVDELDFTQEEKQRAATIGLRALYQMIFIDGLVHADMHPGNIFFAHGPEFIMLDLGLVARLSPRTQKDFLDFFYAMASNDGLTCARIIYEKATYRSPHHMREAFNQRVVALVNDYSSRRAGQFEVSGFVGELFEAQRRFGIRGSTDFMVTILSLLVYEGMVKQLHPDLDFQAEAKQILPKARARLYPRSPWPILFD